MRAIVVGVFAVAMIIFGGGAVSADGAQGNQRAMERRGFETPPGQARKDAPVRDKAVKDKPVKDNPGKGKGLKDQAVSVPDSGSTLTLLSLAIGGALLLRGWSSRRTQPNG
jgi:VPDSG-CTERM motif